MKILHYIPSIDRTSGGVGAYMQLLTTELGKLVELHVVTHREANPLTLENCTVHYIPKNNNPFSNKGKTEFLTLLNDIKLTYFMRTVAGYQCQHTQQCGQEMPDIT